MSSAAALVHDVYEQDFNEVRELRVDMLSLSGHGINGPKGSGALFVSRGMQPPVILRGGHHEHQRRAGTENVPAKRDLVENRHTTTMLPDRLEEGILRSVPEVESNSCCEQRLPNTVNVSFSGVDRGVAILAKLVAELRDHEST